jgi:hypothetical protein
MQANMTSYILSVTCFIFEGQEFKIYGSEENPLFLAEDIVCGLFQ